MDISRPDLKAKRRRRQILVTATALTALATLTWFAMGLKPAAPTVDSSTIWRDTVRRGTMLRQVRGLGTLTRREDAIRQIAAQTAGTVVRILILPGSPVKADTPLAVLSDPETS